MLRLYRTLAIATLTFLTGVSGVASAQEVIVYYHTDAIGSVRMITDESGSVVANYHFLPFGEAFPVDPQAPADKRMFTGAERDPETSFDYLGARYYQSQTGRFTSVDPGHVNGDVLDPQSWNGYAYARNNPLKYTDPTGTTYEICGVDGFGQSLGCNNISDQAFEQLARGRGVYTTGGYLYFNGQYAAYYRQTSVDATFDDFARLTGELSSRWLREQSTQMAVGAAIAATGGLAAGAFSGGLAAGEVLGIGRIAIGVRPSPGQIAQMQQVLAQRGRAGVEKAIRTLERRIAEHVTKVNQARGSGGYTSSMETELRNFRQLIEAAKQVLGK